MFTDHTVSGLTSKDHRTQGEVEVAKAEKVAVTKVVEQKKPMKSAPPESVSTIAFNGDKIEEAGEEKPKRTKEEEEAAKLREQRRLKEIAKAKEALERKRRKAEKAQAREAERAAKEAENNGELS